MRNFGEGFSPLGRTDYGKHTMGRMLRAKNEVSVLGLGVRASPPLSYLLCFTTTEH